MEITLSNIQEALTNNTLLLLSRDEIGRMHQLCTFFNIRIPRFKLKLYKVRLPELKSCNGVQILVRDKGNFFFVGENHPKNFESEFELEEIPEKLRIYAM